MDNENCCELKYCPCTILVIYTLKSLNTHISIAWKTAMWKQTNMFFFLGLIWPNYGFVVVPVVVLVLLLL